MYDLKIANSHYNNDRHHDTKTGDVNWKEGKNETGNVEIDKA